MNHTEYLHLAPTEIGILESAASIFAAKVQNGTVTPANEDEVINHSVMQAIKIARRIDESVRSEGEMG
jgi:hypothetical protein